MTTQRQSDEILLLERIVQRDRAALGQLYDRYARVMYSLAFKILGSVEEAEETTIDVFSQAWRDAHRYDPSRSRVDAWLFLMTRSRALDRLRKRQRQSKVIEVAMETAQTVALQTPNTPEDELLIAEKRESIAAAMAKLPPEQRQAIELAYFQGLTQSEIAQHTGLKLGTVKTRIRLGLGKLKEFLNSA